MSGANSIDFDSLFDGSDQFAEEIANTWMEWDSARNPAKARWKEATQFTYATSTLETINGNIGGLSGTSEDEIKEAEGFSHTTHIPKTAEIYDNLSATYTRATMPHENFFVFEGRDSESSKKEKRDVVEAYLKSKHRSNNIREEYQKIVNDFTLYGNAFASVSFVKEKVELEVGDESFKVAYVGPKVHRISPYDIVFNPLASDFQSSPKIIRTIKNIGELYRDVEESPEGEFYKDILNKALSVRGQIERIDQKDFDKHCQLTFDGYGTASQYFKSGHVEILNLYGDIYDRYQNKFYKNYVITVIDRKFVIRKKPLQTYTGRPLIFHCAWRPRPDNLWGMGPLDNIIGLQYLINHLENARADAFDQMLEPTRVEIGDVEADDGTMSGRPGGRYIIPTGEGDVKNLLPDTTVLNADNQISFKLDQMERFSGLPAQQVGFNTPGEKTLGEVNLLDRNASKMFRNKILQLEGLLEDILNAEIELAKTYMDVEDLIEVVGEDGVKEFLSITRADLKSNGSLVPIGTRYFDRRQQLVQNFQLMQNVVNQDLMIKQHFSSIKVARMYEEIMDLENLGVIHPYVRVGEEAHLMKLQQAAQSQLQNEDLVDLEGETITPNEEDFTNTAPAP